MIGRRRIEIEEPAPVATTLAQTHLRVVLGIIMAAHGWQKVVGYDAWRSQVAELGVPLPEIAAPLAVAAECLGGLGLVFGLLTPIAALSVFGVLATAIATVHLQHGLFQEDGGFEHPLMAAAAALFVLAVGPGPISLDTWLRRRARVRAIQRDEIWTRPPYRPVAEEDSLDAESDAERARFPGHASQRAERGGRSFSPD